jgi:type 1 fimbriae regulatory protein FimB/type 1 fimbriae regulatory protein FimE
MGNTHLKLVTPTIEKRTVMPRRAKNADLRTREYLTGDDVEALMAAARQNRYGHRDATMILIAFRHGLRASEAVDLRWDQVDFNRGVLHVRRSKGGTPSVHPLSGSEMRALRRQQRESKASPFVFVSERGAPFPTAGLARMMERAARSAGFGLKVHPHMLRHACGFALANAGSDTRALQAYLGHRNIQHTVRPARWRGDCGPSWLPAAPNAIQGKRPDAINLGRDRSRVRPPPAHCYALGCAAASPWPPAIR